MKAQSRIPKCAICGERQIAKFKPFCSQKCADIDLGKWFSGSYVVPGDPVDPNSLPDKADDNTE